MTSSNAGTAEQSRGRGRGRSRRDDPSYKWIVLSNTTIGMLLATINASILLIAAAGRISHLPPVATLFAAFLGLQPDPAAARSAVVGGAAGRTGRGTDRPIVLPSI